MHKSIATLLAVLLALTAFIPDAWAGKVGPAFRVNKYTADRQFHPSVAALGDGGFVVTWTSYRQDGDGGGIFGQRYNARNERVGHEFRINTYTSNDQDLSSVAGLGDGGFVVTWSSFGQDGSEYGIYGQRYSAAGARVGGEFRVNTYTPGNQGGVSVAALGDGGLIVTWSSFGDGSDYGIYGQRYNAMGARVDGEFRVNTYTFNNQHSPAVAGLGDRGFVVTWSSWEQDGSAYGIYGQRYNAMGARVGGEFRVNAYAFNDQHSPAVAGFGDGGFVVTWSSYGQDGFGVGIYGQRYNAAGARIGSEFRVNTYTRGNQESPSVAALGDGGFIVAWTSYYEKGDSGFGVYAQRYDAAGAPVGNDIWVHSAEDLYSGVGITGLRDGGFIVAWSSYVNDDPDRDIKAQRFDSRLLLTNFPLPTVSPSTAEVVSVFDHSLSPAPGKDGITKMIYGCDGSVLAFTGDLGKKGYGADTAVFASSRDTNRRAKNVFLCPESLMSAIGIATIVKAASF